MLRIPNGEDVNYDNMKQPYKDEEEFIEQLQNAIWPKTDPESFAALLDEGGKECLEMRYGQRQETCLHRYFTQNKNTDARIMIFKIHIKVSILFLLIYLVIGRQDSESVRQLAFYWKEVHRLMLETILVQHLCI